MTVLNGYLGGVTLYEHALIDIVNHSHKKYIYLPELQDLLGISICLYF